MVALLGADAEVFGESYRLELRVWRAAVVSEQWIVVSESDREVHDFLKPSGCEFLQQPFIMV